MDPVMQIIELTLEIGLVVPPRHAVHPGRSIPLEREESQPEQIDVDVVQERGELLLLAAPCGLPYAVQRL
jgi:hypothetical protein